jgi:hypothetical protein
MGIYLHQYTAMASILGKVYFSDRLNVWFFSEKILNVLEFILPVINCRVSHKSNKRESFISNYDFTVCAANACRHKV